MRVMNPDKLKTLGKLIGGTAVEAVKSGRGTPFVVWNEKGQAYTVASLASKDAKDVARLTARDRKTGKEAESKKPILV